jgi:hypothetical protein
MKVWIWADPRDWELVQVTIEQITGPKCDGQGEEHRGLARPLFLSERSEVPTKRGLESSLLLIDVDDHSSSDSDAST